MFHLLLAVGTPEDKKRIPNCQLKFCLKTKITKSGKDNFVNKESTEAE